MAKIAAIYQGELSDLNKIRISHSLNFGFSGYIFAILRLIVMLCPKSILMKAYLFRNKMWKIIKNN